MPQYDCRHGTSNVPKPPPPLNHLCQILWCRTAITRTKSVAMIVVPQCCLEGKQKDCTSMNFHSITSTLAATQSSKTLSFHCITALRILQIWNTTPHATLDKRSEFVSGWNWHRLTFFLWMCVGGKSQYQQQHLKTKHFVSGNVAHLPKPTSETTRVLSNIF